MAWNDDAQFSSTDRGSNREFGYATLVPTAGGAKATVATRLSVIQAALCIYAEDPARADPLRCDGVITAGDVTIICADPAGNEKVFYEFVGLP